VTFHIGLLMASLIFGGAGGEVEYFFPFHTIDITIPAELQTEHFVNLHREQIQQSRV